MVVTLVYLQFFRGPKYLFTLDTEVFHLWRLWEYCCDGSVGKDMLGDCPKKENAWLLSLEWWVAGFLVWRRGWMDPTQQNLYWRCLLGLWWFFQFVEFSHVLKGCFGWKDTCQGLIYNVTLLLNSRLAKTFQFNKRLENLERHYIAELQISPSLAIEWRHLDVFYI